MMHTIASTLCSPLSITFCLAEVAERLDSGGGWRDAAYNLHAPWGENLLAYGTHEIKRENDILYIPYMQYIRIYETYGSVNP